MSSSLRIAVVAWLLTAICYFYQYMLRSAPAVMMPKLSETFEVNAVGVSAIVGMFYYGYSPFSLITGIGIDKPIRYGIWPLIYNGDALKGIYMVNSITDTMLLQRQLDFAGSARIIWNNSVAGRCKSNQINRQDAKSSKQDGMN